MVGENSLSLKSLEAGPGSLSRLARSTDHPLRGRDRNSHGHATIDGAVPYTRAASSLAPSALCTFHN